MTQIKHIYILVLIFTVISCNNTASEKDKIDKAIKDGKVIIYKADGSIEITDDKNNDFEKAVQSAQDESKASNLTAEEMKFINKLGIDLNLCIEIKKITKKEFVEVKVVNQSGVKINPEMMPKLIESSNITQSQKNDINKYLINNGFNEQIKNNWTNKISNVYYLYTNKQLGLIISRL